jgi:hypothetical protein
LKIGDPEEEPTLSLEPVLEIFANEIEEVALNLGENEIVLDLDDSPSTHHPPPASPNETQLYWIELRVGN